MSTALYYHLFYNFHIGMEASIGMFYENRKGNMYERYEIFDANVNLIDELDVPHIISSNSVSLRWGIFLGLQYQF